MYSRDYVIDYASLERDDLMVYAEGGGQLDYVQREVYAGSERIEQFTDRSNGVYERLLYVHEDLQGNTRYYTKDNGQSFAELTYDAWGMPESPNKLLNNDTMYMPPIRPYLRYDAGYLLRGGAVLRRADTAVAGNGSDQERE